MLSVGKAFLASLLLASTTSDASRMVVATAPPPLTFPQSLRKRSGSIWLPPSPPPLTVEVEEEVGAGGDPEEGAAEATEDATSPTTSATHAGNSDTSPASARAKTRPTPTANNKKVYSLHPEHLHSRQLLTRTCSISSIKREPEQYVDNKPRFYPDPAIRFASLPSIPSSSLLNQYVWDWISHEYIIPEDHPENSEPNCRQSHRDNVPLPDSP